MSHTPLHLIESAAHEGAFGHNLTPEPSAAQCRAGNYKMGRVGLYGLNLVIEQPRGSTRSGVDEKTGKAWSSRMAAHYGYIGGTTGADGDGVDCFIGPYPDAERAYVINQNVGGQFDEHKVMLAFPDLASARSAYLNSYERGWDGLESIVPASLSQLKWWLKGGDLKRPLRADTLPKEGLKTMKKTHWNTDALPYDTSLAQVLYDIRRSDGGDGLLLDAVTAQEILDDAECVIAFDALVTPYAKLERRMELLRGIMERTGDKVKPVALQITDPFKQRGVANVAAIFELSDGQTVSIFFHNPDVTPNKMAPADEVISWKWLLNKKDITIVVAPERGADLNIREVARRIMRLAEKNSEAFQRVNATRAARMQNIQALKDEIATLETELATAQHELEVAKVAAEGKPEFDPTTPEGYVKVRGDEALPAKEAQQKPDITYRNSADGLFTSFFPNTPEGEKAWNIINATPGAEGGKVLAAHAEPTIAQLREAGYTVAEDTSPPATSAEDDEALLKELGGTAAADQQDETQKLIDAYVQSFGAAAAVLNAAVAAVNWDGIIDTQTMRAELDKLGVASRTGQYDIIGKASQELEAGGIKTWDERLSSLREDPGFSAWSAALDAAASARDRVQSIAKERLIAKGTSEVAALTPETPLADVAAAVFHKAGIDTGSQTPQIVAAIEAKDAALAWSILSNLDNKSSAEIFERATGIKLAKTQRDRRPQIDEWAGITAEKRAELEAQRSEAQEAKRRDDNLKWAWNGLTSISVRTTDGTVSNGQDFVKSLFEQGFGEVVARKRGAATSYYVRKGDRITGLKSKNFNGFLKAALAFGGLSQALESLGVAEPQAEKTDAEKIAAVDEAYRFTSATDEFKLWLSESVLKGDYSPFVTAKGMDEAAKRHGAEIEWGEFAGAAMDSVHTIAGEQFDGGEFDTLRVMKKNPKIEDGDVPSKASRDSLVERGYIERRDGYNWLTNEGRDLVASLDDTGHAVAALQQALDVAKNNEPINRTEGNTEQADLEAEVAASIEEAIAILTEGDYEPDEAEVGATFDVETALDSAAGFEVETEVRAVAATKSLLNDFSAFLASDAKFAAALDSAREIATFDSAIVPLRSVMSFGASLSGVEMTTDETERMSTFARDAREISDRLTGRAAATPEKSPALDGVDDDGYVGKVKKGDQVLGRIDIGDDGKAMVYVGQAGDERVKGSEGRPFMYSEDDAPEMVEALFAAEEAPAAAQAEAFVGPAKDRMDALKVLTDTGMNRWMSEGQNKAVIAGLMGEEWKFFADKMKELAGVIAAMPKTYDQDGKGDEAVAHLHYFRGAGDWYITEKDMDGTGTEQAFGLADLYGDGGELGYISIYELTEAGVELDFHFNPKTIGQIRGKSVAEEQPQQTAAPDALPDTSPDVPELIAAGFSRVLNNDYVRSVQAGDKKLQFNIRVTEDGFVVRLTVGFSGGITGAAAEIGRTTDVGAAIAIADAEAAKRGAGDGQADPQKDADRALFQSVIDGTVPDILAPDLADTLEAAFNRNQDDPALVTLFEQAVAAYQNAMLAATANLS